VYGDEYLDLQAGVNFSTSWADISFKTVFDCTATNQLPEK